MPWVAIVSSLHLIQTQPCARVCAPASDTAAPDGTDDIVQAQGPLK